MLFDLFINCLLLEIQFEFSFPSEKIYKLDDQWYKIKNRLVFVGMYYKNI